MRYRAEKELKDALEETKDHRNNEDLEYLREELQSAQDRTKDLLRRVPHTPIDFK